MALRVIAGSAGGIPLDCPKTGNVRPTMEQVRGAIFSSLGDLVPDAQVLDLFAGAGGLGIEALSRGASKATFVEQDRKTLDFLRRNLQKTRLSHSAELFCLDAFVYLKRIVSENRFDLVFADPPYTTAEQALDFTAKLLSSTELSACLAPGGFFVLEKSPSSPLPPDLSGWVVTRQKRYGTTEVLFLQRMTGPE